MGTCLILGMADVLLMKVVASVRRRGGRCMVVSAGRRMKRCCSGVVAGSGRQEWKKEEREKGKGRRTEYELADSWIFVKTLPRGGKWAYLQ